MNLLPHKKTISSMKPSTGGCYYYKKDWVKHFSNKKLLSIVDEYDGKKVTRRIVIKAFEEYFNDNKLGFTKAVLLTMIWGFNTNGYGPYRTNNYLNETNRRFWEDALLLIQEGNTNDAFTCLKKIKGLGISYVSKVLYFAGKAKKIKQYPLIFDMRVARSLVSIVSKGQLNEILNVSPSDSLQSYQKYNLLLHSWSKKIKVHADQIEVFLFSYVNE